MKKIVLIDNNMKEVLNNYILRNNQNVEKIEEIVFESLKVYFFLRFCEISNNF